MLEIERKWLLKKEYTVLDVLEVLDPKDKTYRGYGEQLYLYTSDPQVRVRKLIDFKDSSKKFDMTIKSGSGLSRIEVENSITEEEFGALAKVVGVKPIGKLIWYYKDNVADKTLELMEVNKGQFTYLEVEFNSIEEANNYKLPVEISGMFTECTDSFSMTDVWNNLYNK